MDIKSKEERSYNMSRIRGKNTSIEIILRKALWNRGYRYRIHYNELEGKPDIALTKYRIAVFCDSEFFHGYDWEQLKVKLGNCENSSFWINKISRNMERDRQIKDAIEAKGWIVLRFWGRDIKKNTEACLARIEEIIRNQQSS